MLHQKEDTGIIHLTQHTVLLNLEDDMKCQKFYILFIVLYGACYFCHSQSTHTSFTSIYTTLDRVEVQVKELKMNLIMQQTLSLQLKEQLNKSAMDLSLCQMNLEKVKQQQINSVEQLQTAQTNVKILNKQLQNLEKKYKIWRNVSIAATITTVATTAILILIRK